MKKITVLCLALLLILGIGSIAFGQQKLEFKASGLIDMLAILNRNVPDAVPASEYAKYGVGKLFGPNVLYQPDPKFTDPDPADAILPASAFDKKRSFVKSRGILNFDASMGKEITGRIAFELDSDDWGETGDGRNRMGVWGTDRAAVEVKNVYLSFGVPVIPIPVTITAGLQPFVTRPVLNYTDGAGISADIKIEPASIKLAWFKALENLEYSSDDADVYHANIRFPVDKVTIGGFVSVYNMNTYPFPASPTLTPSYRSNMTWYGVFADGKVGPVGITFDFVYDRGKVEGRGAKSLERDVKYRGFIIRGILDYPWEKFNFGLGAMYASGADTKKTSKDGLPGDVVAYGTGAKSTKVGSYVVPPLAEHVYMDEALVFYGTGGPGITRGAPNNYGAASPNAMARGSYGGTWFAKAYASYKATPWYTVKLQGLYIGDTTKHGNTIGNALKSTGQLRDDSTIGWEFDIFNDIQIYKNLMWRVGAGILFAGDAMEYYNSTTKRNEDPKNPWAIVTRLIYTF